MYTVEQILKAGTEGEISSIDVNHLIGVLKKLYDSGERPNSTNTLSCEALPFTHVLQTIELIRTSFNGSEIVYTHGSCVKFAMILKHIYPTGKILYDLNHAIFEYEGNYFDINGFAKYTKNHIPIEDYGILSAHKSMNLKYKLNEKEKSKMITKLVRTIDKYWKQKNLSKVIHFVNRLKTVAESVV